MKQSYGIISISFLKHQLLLLISYKNIEAAAVVRRTKRPPNSLLHALVFFNLAFKYLDEISRDWIRYCRTWLAKKGTYIFRNIFSEK